MAKYQSLSPAASAAAMAMLGFLMWVVGFVWHGPMGNPSMMGYMYPGFSYMNPLNAFTVLVALVAGFYIVGWLLAVFYNWNLKRK